MPLSTNVTVGQPGHAELHNSERAAINSLEISVQGIQASIPGLSTDAELAAAVARVAALETGGATDAELAVERARILALETGLPELATDAELAALDAAVDAALAALAADGATDAELAVERARILALETGLPTLATDAELAVERARIDALEGASSPAAPFLRPKPGVYESTPHSTQSNGFNPYADAGLTAPAPMICRSPFTIDRLFCRIATFESVAVKLLLYAPDADGYPGELAASGSGTPTGTGGFEVTIPDTDLEPGQYWGFVRSNGGTTIRFVGTIPRLTGGYFDTFSIGMPAANPGGIQADPGTFAAPADPITSYGAWENPGVWDVPVFGWRRKP